MKMFSLRMLFLEQHLFKSHRSISCNEYIVKVSVSESINPREVSEDGVLQNEISSTRCAMLVKPNTKKKNELRAHTHIHKMYQ